jgi:hypothetical protein
MCQFIVYLTQLQHELDSAQATRVHSQIWSIFLPDPRAVQLLYLQTAQAVLKQQCHPSVVCVYPTPGDGLGLYQHWVFLNCRIVEQPHGGCVALAKHF